MRYSETSYSGFPLAFHFRLGTFDFLTQLKNRHGIQCAVIVAGNNIKIMQGEPVFFAFCTLKRQRRGFLIAIQKAAAGKTFGLQFSNAELWFKG